MRGTSRNAAGLAAIEAAGLEGAMADPGMPATLLDLVGGVTVVYWLLGSAQGEAEDVTAIHGSRLERLLEKLVDTPVRGFVYEGVGSVPRADLERGEEIVRAAAGRWRIPVEIVTADPADPANPPDPTAWTEAMLAAATRLTPPPTGRFPPL